MFQKEKITALIKSINLSLFPDEQSKILKMFASKESINESDFNQIPCVSKFDVFSNNRIYGGLYEIGPFKLTFSAGDQKNICFRIGNNEYKAPIETFFTKFNLRKNETLIINCYPFGINPPTDSVSSLEVGPRPNLLFSSIEVFKPYYENIIIIMQPHFLKHFFDIYKEINVPPNILFVLGGCWFPSTIANYLSRKLQIEVEEANQKTISMYGASEVGLGIGIQGPNENLMRHFCQSPYPMVFEVDWSRFYIESIDSKIIITNLTPNNGFSLIRYHLGDHGFLKNNLLYLYDKSNSITVMKLQEIIFSNEILSDSLTLNFSVNESEKKISIQTYQVNMNNLENTKKKLKEFFPDYSFDLLKMEEKLFHYNPFLKNKYD